MNNFLLRRDHGHSQSQRLKLISRAAAAIRRSHEAGEITAAEAAQMLVKLRSDPRGFIEQSDGKRAVGA